MTRAPDRHQLIGIGLLVLVIAFLAAVFSGGLQSLFSGGGGRTITAEFATAQQLASGDPVRIDGVDVGQVQSVTLRRSGVGALVRMHLDSDAGPLYRNATAQIRFRTALGGAFAVAVNPGSSGSGPLEGPIALERTSSQVEVDDVLDVTRGDARIGLQQLPRSLAATLAKPSVLPTLLRTTATAAPGIGAGATAARGTEPGYDIPQLIDAADRTTAALNAPANALGGLVSHSATTVTAISDARRPLSSSLAALPHGLLTTRTTLHGLQTTLALVRPVLDRLNLSASRLAPTLTHARTTALRADHLLRAAVPLLRQLRPASVSLGHLALNGTPLIEQLEPGLQRLDTTVLPMLGKKDPVTGKPLGTMIGGWGAALGSGAAAGEDANGHFIRFPATIGDASLYLPCQTYLNDPDHQQQIECASLQQDLATLLGGASLTTRRSP